MKHYLLFDSGCCQCSKIAKSIEKEAGGRLTTRSLRDPEVKELLDHERPGWKWEPLLLEEGNDKIRVYSGASMSLRMITVLGPIRAWKVARLMWATSQARMVSENTQATVYSGRRDFLR